MTIIAPNFLLVSFCLNRNKLFLFLVWEGKSPIQAIYPSKLLNIFTYYFYYYYYYI